MTGPCPCLLSCPGASGPELSREREREKRGQSLGEVNCLEQWRGGSVNEAEPHEGFGGRTQPFHLAQLLCKFHHPLTWEPSSESLPSQEFHLGLLSQDRSGGRKLSQHSQGNFDRLYCLLTTAIPGTLKLHSSSQAFLGSSSDYLRRKHPSSCMTTVITTLYTRPIVRSKEATKVIYF